MDLERNVRAFNLQQYHSILRQLPDIQYMDMLRKDRTICYIQLSFNLVDNCSRLHGKMTTDVDSSSVLSVRKLDGV